MPLTALRPKQGTETHDSFAELTDAGALVNASWSTPPDPKYLDNLLGLYPFPQPCWSEHYQRNIVFGWDFSNNINIAATNAGGLRTATGTLGNLNSPGQWRGITLAAAQEFLFAVYATSSSTVPWTLAAGNMGATTEPQVANISIVTGGVSTNWFSLSQSSGATFVDSQAFGRFFGYSQPATIIAGHGESAAIELALVYPNGLAAGFDYLPNGPTQHWDDPATASTYWRRNPNNDFELTGLQAGERLIAGSINNADPAGAHAAHTCYALMLQSTNLRRPVSFSWTPASAPTESVDEGDAAASRQQIEVEDYDPEKHD